MSDLVEILKSSGPVPLDELNLRSSEAPGELASKIETLKRQGFVQVSGPYAESMASLGPEEIETASETVVSLTRSAFKSGR